MTTTNPTQLKRSLKLPTVTFYGLGAILGAGIYVLMGEVAATAGYFAPLSFLMAALIALFSAFSYSELSARFPLSAGEAVYIDKAFNRQRLTQLVGLMVVVTGIVSAATMATGVVGYAQLFVPWPQPVIVIIFVLSIAAVASLGIEQSTWVVTLITLLEVSGLLYVLFMVGDNLTRFPTAQLTIDHLSDRATISGIFLGSFLAFYAYIGFEDMVNIAEEIKRPEKILPIAILLALVIATLLYMLVSYAALSVLSPEELANSSAPLADVIIAKGGSAALITLISLIAVINGAIVQIIMASRVIYGLAVKQLLPARLAVINIQTATPINATLCCGAITLLLALWFPLGSLAQATSMIVLSVFALVNVALIRINSRLPIPSTLHYPAWVPYIGSLLCVAMLMAKVVSWL
jgi:amino acid transporter